jgi:pyruvate,water dikinase
LRDAAGGKVELPQPTRSAQRESRPAEGESPRQIVGQPAAPGLATATSRRVRGPNDLKRFRAGEVLICDAIQPTMSHIVPLAAAIVEKRGGMLIHGAIIAREIGIPCVNGVSDSILSIEDGEIVTVDGHLGIVTIGAPEFGLETDNEERPA